MADTPKRYATRDFTDAGLGRTFSAGTEVDVDAGALANYEAAGLVGDKAAAAAETKQAPTKGA